MSHFMERNHRVFGVARLLIACIGIWSLGNTSTVWAVQEVEMIVSPSSDEIFVGESVDLLIEIRNAKNPVPPDIAVLRETFTVEEIGNESRNQSSTLIINGRVSQKTQLSHVYQYRLTPKRSGELTIPELSSTIDGKEIKSQRWKLKVTEPEEQDIVLLEVKVDQQRLYPTQSFVVTLSVWVKPIPGEESEDPLRPLRRSPPHLELNWVDIPDGLSSKDNSQWLSPKLARGGIGFTLNNVAARTNSFFDGGRAAVLDLSDGRETRNGLDGSPVSYYRYELSRSFTADKVGVYTFGPAVLKGTFVTGMSRREYLATKIVAIAPTISVEVRDIPTPRPATYCGGIGEYRWNASASPESLRVGDPLTLTLEVEPTARSGSLERIAAPDLSSNSELMDRFDLLDKNPTGRLDGRLKKFSYALRPKKPDVEIPSISLSTFDPSNESFVDVSLPPIPLKVTEASKLSSGELVGSLPNSNASDNRSKAEGIFQNVVDPSRLKDEQIPWRPLATMVASCWGGALASIGWMAWVRKRGSDPKQTRRQQARKAALRQLEEGKELLAQGKKREALRALRAAFMRLQADLQGKVLEGLTPSDLAQAMDSSNVPSTTRERVQRLLELAETSEFGGGDASDILPWMEEAPYLIKELAPFLEKGARK